MLMRYYWGLGVGHTYSHVLGSGSNQTKSNQASPQDLYSWSSTSNSIFRAALDTLPAASGTSWRFDNLDNNFLPSNLGWEHESYDGGKTKSGLGDKGTSFLTGEASSTFADGFNDGFDNFEPNLSLVDLDDLEWVSHDNKAKDECTSDDDSNASVMYEMYSSDWGDKESE